MSFQIWHRFTADSTKFAHSFDATTEVMISAKIITQVGLKHLRGVHATPTELKGLPDPKQLTSKSSVDELNKQMCPLPGDCGYARAQEWPIHAHSGEWPRGTFPGLGFKHSVFLQCAANACCGSR